MPHFDRTSVITLSFPKDDVETSMINGMNREVELTEISFNSNYATIVDKVDQVKLARVQFPDNTVYLDSLEILSAKASYEDDQLTLTINAKEDFIYQ